MFQIQHGIRVLIALGVLVSDAGAAAEPERATQLIAAIHQNNSMEMEWGQLAFAKGINLAVKDFGQQMAMAHNENEAKLLKLLGTEKWTLGPGEADAHAETQALRTKSGLEFDKAYIDATVDQHERLLARLKRDQDKLPEGPVRQFVSDTLAAGNQHTLVAKQIVLDLNARP